MASIRKRVWQAGGESRSAWVCDYTDQSGARRLRTFPTRRAADSWLVEARGQVAAGVHTADSTSCTVAQAADAWIARGEAEGLEAATLKAYRSRVRYHIVPLIGAERLSRLTKPRVEQFIAEMLRTDRSRAMAQKCLTNLKGIIGHAQSCGLVGQNVARDVRLKRDKRHKRQLEVGVDLPTPAEVRALLAAAPARWRPLLAVAVFCGLRASELRGLRWVDVDLGARTLRVTQRADEKGAMGSPKSAAARREIPLAPHVVSTLREWRLACPPGEQGLVFPNGRGRPESIANIHNRVLQPLQQQLGMVDAAGRFRYGLHAFRHFFASWVISQGFQPKRVQALLGHSTIVLTLDRYSHWFPNEADDQARLAAGEGALLA